MRKQTHSKKKKAANPKRKVAKKAQRQIRGGAAVTVIRPTSERIDFGDPGSPYYVIVRTPGIVIFDRPSTGEAPTAYQIGFGPRVEIAP